MHNTRGSRALRGALHAADCREKVGFHCCLMKKKNMRKQKHTLRLTGAVNNNNMMVQIKPVKVGCVFSATLQLEQVPSVLIVDRFTSSQEKRAVV